MCSCVSFCVCVCVSVYVCLPVLNLENSLLVIRASPMSSSPRLLPKKLHLPWALPPDYCHKKLHLPWALPPDYCPKNYISHELSLQITATKLHLCVQAKLDADIKHEPHVSISTEAKYCQQIQYSGWKIQITWRQSVPRWLAKIQV